MPPPGEPREPAVGCRHWTTVFFVAGRTLGGGTASYPAASPCFHLFLQPSPSPTPDHTSKLPPSMDMSQFNAAEQATLAKAIEAKQVSSTVADGVPPTDGVAPTLPPSATVSAYCQTACWTVVVECSALWECSQSRGVTDRLSYGGRATSSQGASAPVQLCKRDCQLTLPDAGLHEALLGHRREVFPRLRPGLHLQGAYVQRGEYRLLEAVVEGGGTMRCSGRRTSLLPRLLLRP